MTVPDLAIVGARERTLGPAAPFAAAVACRKGQVVAVSAGLCELAEVSGEPRVRHGRHGQHAVIRALSARAATTSSTSRRTVRPATNARRRCSISPFRCPVGRRNGRGLSDQPAAG
jgi:hypothetical protein